MIKVIMEHNRNSTLVTFNCKNVKRSVECVRSLCKRADLIALQETWLVAQDLPFLGNIDDNFSYTGKSAIDFSSGVRRGRPFGGVAILWRKSVFTNVSVVHSESDRITAIRANIGNNREVVVICVYMPTDQSDNLPLFTNCLGEISAIVEQNNVESVFILGDFNAHPSAPFCDELLNFCNDNEWICADIDKLGRLSDTHTFYSDAHHCKRWLDHCLVTESAGQTITSIHVDYGTYWSDHLPLIVNCNLDIIKTKCILDKWVPNDVLWGERESSEIGSYSDICNNKLKDLDFPIEFCNCADSMCSNFGHRYIIDNLYDDIVNILCDASVQSKRGRKLKKGKTVVGWNKHVKEAHRQAREAYQRYLVHGKPESGPVRGAMYLTRKTFKSRLKFCQNHQDQLKMDVLASHVTVKDFRAFWKSTKRMNGRVSLPVSVGGCSEPKGIANLFKNHFKVEAPLTSNVVVPGAEAVAACENPIGFSAQDVKRIIDNMKRGKSPGSDGLSIEHLQHAGTHLFRVLAMLFTFCMRHAYLPPKMTKTIVVPIAKNRTGDVTDKCNYRPISLATVMAKVFDGLLDAQLSKYVKLHDAQFGFRESLSTESAILTLKHTVAYYVDRKTPIYACFLDLSKAFDLVDYNRLWSKLGEVGAPAELINILSFWYNHQKNVVKWGNAYSDEYKLECGVRQGGLTSPRLFNLYIDQLIDELSNSHVGCHIDNVCVNNISYADDMVLLSPSVGGLRKLLGMCEAYAGSHGLKYNDKKSEYMLIRGKIKQPEHIPPVYLNGVSLSRVSQFRYLGHVVTETLHDDADIERERRALSVRANMLVHRFARCTAQVKVTLFRAYCQSFYTSALWTNYTQRAYNALRVQYNNAFRILVRLPRFCSASGMFADARVDDFFAIMRKKSASLIRRIRGSGNEILRMIADRPVSPVVGRLIRLHVL